MRAGERWRARATTLEAMALLATARLLVAHVPFARWRDSLGEPATPGGGDPAVRLDANVPARQLARAVERGAARLPGESRCLPRAMALQWLLRRHGLGAALVIGVRPGQDRGGLDDLHAWVVREGEILLGATETPHLPLYSTRIDERRR